MSGAIGVVACKDLTGSPGLPAGTPDPSTYNTATGAIGLRNTAIAGLETAIARYVTESGLLSDEFEDVHIDASAGLLTQDAGEIVDPLDERILPEGVGATGGTNWTGTYSYAYLQKVRADANLALGALAAYDTAPAALAGQRVMRSELFAVQGYAEILLADLFCSGVPLSTLDFQHDFTYAPSSTTQQVYRDALGKLDSAAALATGSDSVLNLVRVLRGRAYIDLGIYDSAAAAVADVSPAFQYTFAMPFGTTNAYINAFTVSNQEGENGLPFRTSGDPRTATIVTCTPPQTFNPYCPVDTLTFPAKYANAFTGSTGYAPFVMADGIEAQLIQAESQLQPVTQASGGAWLTTLNTLRRSVSLPDTSDPGTPNGRVALLLRERAFWLFATGHRQGDLRRALRQYGTLPGFQSEGQVYPTGPYTAPGTGRYGSDVTAPIPTSEYINPDYHGCQNRNP